MDRLVSLRVRARQEEIVEAITRNFSDDTCRGIIYQIYNGMINRETQAEKLYHYFRDEVDGK